MDEVKIGRLGPFPRVNKPVFIVSILLIVGFIIFGAFLLKLRVRCLASYKILLLTNLVGFYYFSQCGISTLYLLSYESLW